MKWQPRMLLAAAGLIAAATPSLAAEKVTIGGGPYLDIPQLSVAMDQDTWADHGIEANVIPFQSGRDAFEALLGGQLDFAFIAEFPAVIGAMQGKEFAVIAEMSEYQGTRLIHAAGSELTLADLAGKPIGVTSGTNVHFMLETELKKNDIQVEIVSVGPPDIVPAMARGDVFAGATFPSFYQGAKKLLGDKYGEIRVPSYQTRFILVATKEVIDAQPETVTGVLQALLDGEAVVASDPEEAQAAVGRITSGTISAEDIATAWGESRHEMRLDTSLVDLMLAEGVWIHERGSIRGDMPVRDTMQSYIEPKFLTDLAADRVTLN